VRHGHASHISTFRALVSCTCAPPHTPARTGRRTLTYGTRDPHTPLGLCATAPHRLLLPHTSHSRVDFSPVPEHSFRAALRGLPAYASALLRTPLYRRHTESGFGCSRNHLYLRHTVRSHRWTRAFSAFVPRWRGHPSRLSSRTGTSWTDCAKLDGTALSVHQLVLFALHADYLAAHAVTWTRAGLSGRPNTAVSF